MRQGMAHAGRRPFPRDGADTCPFGHRIPAPSPSIRQGLGVAAGSGIEPHGSNAQAPGHDVARVHAPRSSPRSVHFLPPPGTPQGQSPPSASRARSPASWRQPPPLPWNPRASLQSRGKTRRSGREAPFWPPRPRAPSPPPPADAAPAGPPPWSCGRGARARAGRAGGRCAGARGRDRAVRHACDRAPRQRPVPRGPERPREGPSPAAEARRVRGGAPGRGAGPASSGPRGPQASGKAGRLFRGAGDGAWHRGSMPGHVAHCNGDRLHLSPDAGNCQAPPRAFRDKNATGAIRKNGPGRMGAGTDGWRTGFSYTAQRRPAPQMAARAPARPAMPAGARRQSPNSALKLP